ncbi:MAG: cell division protein FtsA [Nitrospinae bacterium RIFCSPLOWO2_02_FULL_39_110]|nr:MAG: cell division protein FtsA [Nitrospinae bacterium RIFCSPHIGHO2_12_FULL_39_42]OGW01534.1 MAG: cell division protein FtsA [Nitrospinae bacterium RIFCSPHIGHO2_02_FULL_39_82]OGW05632.1 MAG: cell division protein FtsA [Nitrospinae bacterium RIFCSPLOWO2_02_FULL_39_110]OGW06992.1 MAG: cell division protein FtsA [Nitrospinae bacterium RIFCSPLOWO2_02_39_17]OGW10633.1 MAG: cell division protein FtsA [Nitrospinae bacterium RIFCSPLOWO2_12_39_15]OGW10862.1 MAG: cell division protein FtsA [Nitrospin
MSKGESIIAGLDIGTTKICCIISEAKGEKEIDIIGIGSHPSRGLRKGVVVNIESTVESIKGAVEEAELMAGCEVDSVYVGIAGGHIKGFNSHGIIAVKNKEVNQPDIDRVLDAAQAVAIPPDREVIHIIPQEFILDGQEGIKEPLGMTGIRLEAKVHIVTGAVTSAQNIIRSVNKAGLEVKDIVLEQIASSDAVLDRDEKELGVAMVDIGGGTSDLAIFFEESIKHTSVLAIGGNHITNDIAIGLRTPQVEAEKVKKTYGCAMTSMVKKDDTIEVPSTGGRDPRVLSRQILCEIIEPRLEEMFNLIKREIDISGYSELIASGIVLTGGSAIMSGMPELAEKIFKLPVRRGFPKGIGGLVDVVNNPMYATSVGLVLFGLKAQQFGKKPKLTDKNLFDKIFNRMKEWVEDFF